MARDPLGKAALQEYLDNKEDLHAGRTPQRDKEAHTLRELCNRFLNSKRTELEAGKLSPRTFIDYERVCRRLAEKLGSTRAVTKRFGKVTVKAKQDDAIAKQTAKLLRELGLKRHGVSFYALRHTFETQAGESKDQVAVDHIMGYIDSTMAGEYREEISDARLRLVVDVVHEWLFPRETDADCEEPATVKFSSAG